MKKFLLILFSLFLTTLCFAAPNKNKPFYIQHWKTNNGVPVYFIQRPGLKFVDIELIYAAGSSFDGEKYGLANATQMMLPAGTKTMTATELSHALTNRGSTVSADTGRDMSSVSLRSLSDDNLLPSVKLFTSIVNEPVFPESEMQRVKNELLTSIKLQQEEPTEQALEAFFKEVYVNHPYAHNPIGTESTINALKRDDLIKFYKRFYNTNNVMLAIVGDLTTKRARALSNLITKNMPKGKSAPKLPMVKPLNHAVSKVVAMPTKQTTVIIGQDGLTRKYKYIMPLRLANHILGVVPLDSILFKKIRKQSGLVYGVSSHLLPLKYGGVFFVLLQTKNSSRDQAADMVKKELKLFYDNKVSPELLKSAKQNMIGSFPIGLYNNEALAGNLANIAFYDQSLDYLQAYPRVIEQITAKQVQQAFQGLVNPEQLATVMVGNDAKQAE